MPSARYRDLAWRSALAILCIVLPILFYFAALPISVGRLVDVGAQKLGDYTISLQPECKEETSPPPAARIDGFLAADFSAKYNFGISSSYLRILAVLSVFVSAGILVFLSRKWFAALIVIPIFALSYLCFVYANGAGAMREYLLKFILNSDGAIRLLYHPLDAANGPGVSYQYWMIDREIGINIFAVVLGIISALFGLAFIAFRRQLNTPEHLKARLLALRVLLVTEAAILVLSVISSKALADWALGLLCPPQGKALAPIGVAIVNYWGAAMTGVIVFGFVPAYLAWWMDVQAAARAAEPGSDPARKKFVDDAGLSFAPWATVLTLLTMALPALSGAFSGLLSGIAGIATK